MCKPACNCSSAPNCSPLEMNDKMRQNIVSYMNQIREIQTKGEPQPAGLSMLEYDKQLEEISACWAMKCENEHSECFYTPRFSETSQNVGVRTGKERNINLWYDVINSWFGEIKTLNAGMLSNLPSGETGLKMHNFAQLLSERIRFVGCSWSVSPEWVLIVCTFGPRGPLQGQPIFKTGPPCSACSAGYECDYMKPFEQLCKRKDQRSSSSRLLPFSKGFFDKNEKKIAKTRKHEKKESTKNNLNHPWAGIYVLLLLLLVTVVILFVFGFAFYCICFY